MNDSLTNNLLLQNMLFTGKVSTDFGNLISVQMTPVYESLGIIIPVKSSSIMAMIKKHKIISLADLSKALHQSHQLVNQKLPKLHQLNLITKESDPNDKRCKVFSLTEQGEKQVQLLTEQSEKIRELFCGLSTELGVDIHALLESAIDALNNESLLTRFEKL
ncbi:MarR family transcriptional regulator [Thalassotalea marina]|uniref:HTH marR-type domain-containing protein n=1 Tax=Thalassotalea marina TaxID=1673741 RepID=A0A919ELL7_9GAMM|nr:MarR family transcriptional regulator [Thalassotalea marina]GHF92107.1 hypothetical protein GCM10017161_20200 [Thalassotalea marina]